jgi:RND family efflux transporter MFP subunit
MPEPSKDGSKPKGLTLKHVGAGAVVLALVVVAFGVSSRAANDRQLEATSTEVATPTVAVVRPKNQAGDDGFVLPGEIQALNSAPIHARTDGYVKSWLVDIGDTVSAGQTLAILTAPEVDEQLAASRAEYETAQANETLARSTAERWRLLLARNIVSQQAVDEKVGDQAAKTAVTNAARANIRRLEALRGFTRIQAPFAGVITSRSAQLGALVTANSASTEPLFTVSDIHRVRVYVNVPQSFSASLKTGMHAKMTVPEFPGREFDMELTRDAGAVDARSGTMLVELQTANPTGELKPGSYAQVEFSDLDVGTSLYLPATTLLFGADGPVVAVVGPDRRITIRPVTIGRDTGKTVEILAGIDENSQVVDNPPDAIAKGDLVRISPK